MDDNNADSIKRAFFVLPAWSSVTVTGRDRQTFLHNFCTNDIKRLVPGTSCEAFFCNAKGRIMGHGLVSCRDDGFVIVGPGEGAALVAHLDRYIIREDVVLQDLSAERTSVVIFGGGFANELAAAAGVVRSSAPTSQWQYTNAPARIDGADFNWIEWPLCGPQTVLIETGPSRLPSIDAWLGRHGAASLECEAFDAARIEAGMPLFGIDFDDRNFPQEVERDEQAISYTKGCYLGQETVARIDALGHVNQRLVGVRFFGEMPPQAGFELTHAGTTVGRLTSAAHSLKLGAPLGLAMVRREHTAVGSRLDSPVGVCEVARLPIN